ncbi:amidohydrolase [Paracoccus sp. J39]|uniref:amidohydrolase family protein n=1 Tax=Paracoccus sp. J39 TaxID=935848 RepID=UPI000A028093|nr:amidohydrolase family protein [Paracoccus sp. J39]
MKRGMPPHHWVDVEWLAQRTEEVLDPDLPIVDAHHHLWDNDYIHYLAPDFQREIEESGHNVRGSVFIEAKSMYNADAADANLACLGEVEFANGVGAAYASGRYGRLRMCAGIVGTANLMLGAAVEEVLAASIARAPDRYRGVRFMTAWDASPEVNTLRQPPEARLMAHPTFREGFAKLGPLGLTFDAWCYHPQLPELIDLVDAFPDTPFIINHMAGRTMKGPYKARKDEVFQEWTAAMRELANRPNTHIKIGSIGMRHGGFDFIDRDLPPTSEEMAEAWKPLVEACIEPFGPSRVIFESNFPVDKAGVSYRALWNTFKRITAGYSADERRDMFAGTAVRAYRLPAELGQP